MSGASVPPPYTPQPAPPTSSGWAPWVIACAVVGGIGAVVLVAVAVVAAVGCAIFLKPVKPTAVTPPPPAVAPMAPNPASPATPENPEPSASGISGDEAVEKVKALPEVAEWVAIVTANGGSPHIDVDSEDAATYTVHVYEIVTGDPEMPSHTATLGWFIVDKVTGEVRKDVP